MRKSKKKGAAGASRLRQINAFLKFLQQTKPNTPPAPIQPPARQKGGD